MWFLIPVYLLIFGFAIGAGVWIMKLFNEGRRVRQKNAEEQRQRHGGESVLEWDGPYAEGEPDPEFGRLVVQFKQKMGSGYTQFYERGLVRGKRRLPYSEVKDMLVLEGSAPKMATSLRRIQNDRSTGLNIYPKKGTQMVVSKFDHEIDLKLLRDVQNGLGYRN